MSTAATPTEELRSSNETAPRHLPWLAGLVVTAGSLLAPMSYDEAYWLGVARLVAAGHGLYDTALDNKTPPVYLLTWLLDVLPGPYVVARSVFMGAMVVILARSLGRLPGLARGSWVALYLAVGVALLAELQPATEFVAVALIVGAMGMTGTPDWRVAAMLLAAASFDPRVVLLFPAVVWWIRRRRPASRWALPGWVAAGTVTALALVLVVPDLRFGLVELNTVSRVLQSGPLAVARSGLYAGALALPLVPLVDWARIDAPTKTIMASAAILPFVSMLPIAHYWIHLTALLALLPRRATAAVRLPVVAAAALLALTPVAVATARAAALHRQMADTADRVTAHLRDVLPPSGTYAMFGSLPHVTVATIDETVMYSPTSNYLTDGTSRTARYRAGLEVALTGVDAIVEDGALSAPLEAVFEIHRGTRRLFDAVVDRFPCRAEFDGAIVHSPAPCR